MGREGSLQVRELRPVLINLWAPPGVGKSRTQAALFHMMKMEGFKCEAPYEFAKECVYQGNRKALQDALYITGVQEHRNWSLRGQVDFIISDSPTGTSLAYISATSGMWQPLLAICQESREGYRCSDFYLNRCADRPFEEYGRAHDLRDSIALEPAIHGAMTAVRGRRYPDPAPQVLADRSAAKTILQHVMTELRNGR